MIELDDNWKADEQQSRQVGLRATISAQFYTKTTFCAQSLRRKVYVFVETGSLYRLTIAVTMGYLGLVNLTVC
jgi:hypothetical protein